MGLGPVSFPGITAPVREAVSQAQGQDLLLGPFQGSLVVIPHPDIFLHCQILGCGNINGAVSTKGQTLCQLSGIPFVRLDFPGLKVGDRGRRKDYSLMPCLGKLVVQGVTETSSLITADKLNICAGGKLLCLPDGVHVFKHFPVIRRDRCFSEKSIIIKGIAAKSKICSMDIHAKIDYNSIHK